MSQPLTTSAKATAYYEVIRKKRIASEAKGKRATIGGAASECVRACVKFPSLHCSNSREVGLVGGLWAKVKLGCG